MEQRYIDTEGAAVHLATTARHIKRLRDERRIPFYKVGGKVRFRIADLDAYLDANRYEATR